MAHRLAHLGRHIGGRGFLDHLLVAPLQRAIALEQMHRALAVTKDLHFDMARLFDVFLNQHNVIAKSLTRLRLRGLQGRGEIAGRINAAHAFATTARDGLDQNRIADLFGFTRQTFLRRAVIARNDGNAGILHQRFGRVFEAHRADGFGGRPDKYETRSLNFLNKFRVFRQEPVARMYRFCASFQRGVDHRIAKQIALLRGGAA